MATSLVFLPKKFADILNYASQVETVVSDEGFVPASLGLSADQVTALTAKLTAAQAAYDAKHAAVLAAQSTTQALSAPNAAMDQLVATLRDIAMSARVSDATDDAIAAIGVSRRDANPTPKMVSLDSPEFTLASVVPGMINVRFRTRGSEQPRARDASAIGVQIAVVNGAAAPADGEADSAPNQYVSRSPASINSAGYPANVRLYARWISQRGQTSPWSLPLAVAVM